MMIRIAVAVAVALGAAEASALQDVIKLRAGGEAKGKVTQLTSTKVVYTDAGGKAVTLKNEEVADVLLSDTPKALRDANAAAGSKNWVKALNLYEAALGEIGPGKARDLHKQYALFGWALALEGDGKTDAALAKLRQLRKDCGDCRLERDSFTKSMEIARKSGDAALLELLAEMKQKPEPLASEAGIEEARMKYAKGEFDAAMAGYTRLASAANPLIAAEARLGHLRCLRALKKTDELESLCSRILGDKMNSSPALLQSASASLGDALLRKADKDPSKAWEAYHACTQAIAAGPPASKDQAEDYVLALLNAGRACVLLSKAAAKPEAKAEQLERAGGYFQEVARAYKGTSWSAAAEKELAALRAPEKPAK